MVTVANVAVRSGGLIISLLARTVQLPKPSGQVGSAVRTDLIAILTARKFVHSGRWVRRTLGVSRVRTFGNGPHSGPYVAGGMLIPCCQLVMIAAAFEGLT